MLAFERGLAVVEIFEGGVTVGVDALFGAGFFGWRRGDEVDAGFDGLDEALVDEGHDV